VRRVSECKIESKRERHTERGVRERVRRVSERERSKRETQRED